MFKKILNFIKEKKNTLILILLFLVFGYFFGKKFLFKPKEPKYKTAPVVKKDLSSVISASGEIKADEEASLKFQTAGQLAWVGVKKGDKVNKWQAIASLDQRVLEKTLKQELLDYMNGRWDHEQVMLDDYRDTALTETIRRVKEKSQFDLDRIVLDVEIADIALKYTTLISPIKGIVTKIDIPHPGVNIKITDEIVISNPEKVVFSANVDETDIGQVKKGLISTLILDTYPEEEINTSVNEINFTSTITSGGGTAFAVKFDLPPNTQNEKFRLGMNGDIEIFIEKRENILSVPFEAIQENGEEEPFVWLVKEDGVEKQQVKTGISNDIDTQILQGLEEGDQIVISDFKSIEKNHKK